jgi:hypothetical protein
MNYIKHLTGFFDRIIPDRNLNPTHVSLYIALFQFWNVNRFKNPISITRDEVMRICKISSKATYHKCMRDLNDKNYIKYEPSYNPYKGSMVTLFDFSAYLKPVQNIETSTKKILSKNEQVLNKQGTASETSTGTSSEQALVSSINNTNITNNTNIQNDLNLDEQAKNFENDNIIARNEAISEKNEMPLAFADTDKNQTASGRQKEKSSAKKEMLEVLADDNRKIVPTFADTDEKQTEKSRQKENNPSIAEVKSYFLQQNFPELEANKFFNYFSSVGWLVGGKIPMVDWQAAAQNWMLNAIKFKSYEKPPDRAKHLNTENDKDYGEPL